MMSGVEGGGTYPALCAFRFIDTAFNPQTLNALAGLEFDGSRLGDGADKVGTEDC